MPDGEEEERYTLRYILHTQEPQPLEDIPTIYTQRYYTLTHNPLILLETVPDGD